MKTPLTVIRMYAEMLEAFSGEIPEKREEHVRMILDETDRLTNFISDTLDLAKLQSGTMEMHPSVFAIQDVAEEVSVSYTHLRAHETDSYLVCRLLLLKKKKNNYITTNIQNKDGKPTQHHRG